MNAGDVIAFEIGDREFRGIVDTDGRPYTTDQTAAGHRAVPDSVRRLAVIDPNGNPEGLAYLNPHHFRGYAADLAAIGRPVAARMMQWLAEQLESFVPDSVGYRIKVACINWGHDDAPHALVYGLVGGQMTWERYFDTWAEAVEWARERSEQAA